MPESPIHTLRSALRLALLACVLVPAFAFADELPEQPRIQTVLVQTKHADVRELKSIVEMLDVEVAVRPERNVLVLRGMPGNVETARAVIDNLDQPPQPRNSVEVTTWVLAMSKKNGTPAVPPVLQPVVTRLRSLFDLHGAEVLDTLFLRVLDSRPGRVVGSLPFEAVGSNVYQLSFDRLTLSPRDGGHSARFDRLRFEYQRRPSGESVNLDTDIDLVEGQLAVVGKATPSGAERTLVLVMSVDVLDDGE